VVEHQADFVQDKTARCISFIDKCAQSDWRHTESVFEASQSRRRIELRCRVLVSVLLGSGLAAEPIGEPTPLNELDNEGFGGKVILPCEGL
jgi:hypothetical protein